MSIQKYINDYSNHLIRSQIVVILLATNMIIYLIGFMYYKSHCKNMDKQHRYILKKIVNATGTIFIVTVILITISVFSRLFVKS